MYPRALLVLVAIPAWAQFSELAITDDASQVYFTSPLTLTSDTRANPGSESRIYRWNAGKVELSGERGSLVPSGPTTSSSSSDGAAGAQVSGDGTLFGYTLRNVCPKPAEDTSGCAVAPSLAVLRGAINASLGEGSLQLSRNGRYALVIPAPLPFFDRDATLFDTQSATAVSVPPPTGDVAVASDGSVLTGKGVWRSGAVTPFGISGPFRPLALSGDGSALAYNRLLTDSTGRVIGFELTVRKLRAATDAVVFTPAANTQQLPQLMSISDDGRWVLYRVTTLRIEGPAFLADTQTGTSTPIPLVDGELASGGALNAQGDVAVLATTFHRLVKIGFAKGAVNNSEVIVPATPYSPVPRLSPGSMARLSAPMPPGSQGRILIDGVPAPVLAATNDQYVIQVPWDQRTGQAAVTFDFASQSPFRAVQSALVFGLSPAFETADAGTYPLLGLKMIKADFSGLVTSQPAPGQIVHTYMTGLGKVLGSVQTGSPAPLDSLRPITGTFQCRFFPFRAPAETLFAGLAPGLAGIYQVTFRFPNETPSGPLTGGDCSLSGPEGSAGFTFVSTTLSQP